MTPRLAGNWVRPTEDRCGAPEAKPSPPSSAAPYPALRGHPRPRGALLCLARGDGARPLLSAPRLPPVTWDQREAEVRRVPWRTLLPHCSQCTLRPPPPASRPTGAGVGEKGGSSLPGLNLGRNWASRRTGSKRSRRRRRGVPVNPSFPVVCFPLEPPSPGLRPDHRALPTLDSTFPANTLEVAPATGWDSG